MSVNEAQNGTQVQQKTSESKELPNLTVNKQPLHKVSEHNPQGVQGAPIEDKLPQARDSRSVNKSRSLAQRPKNMLEELEKARENLSRQSKLRSNSVIKNPDEEKS